jgi:two-component system response regulator AtoC
MMPGKDGIETLRDIRTMSRDLPVIMLSGASSPSHVVSAMKSGATDFLGKPVAHEELGQAIHKALGGRHAVRRAPAVVPPSTRAFFGDSPQMKEILDSIGRVGHADIPVLIQGETGTGKEVLARELHARSQRADKVFLKLNCAALPSELVESELFGYERGAFTGAVQSKPGMFEISDGGTILLDEIGDMDYNLQAKLLHVLQDHEFRRVGGKEPLRVDVRVIATTHRLLEDAIGKGRFREDLYYRLNVVTLRLPALRERKEEILPLADFLLRKHQEPGKPALSLASEMADVFTNYHWPGNIRELENVIRRFIVLRDPDAILREMHARARCAPVTLKTEPVVVAPHAVAEANVPVLEQVTQAKEKAEADAILRVLTDTHWNRKRAAMLLHIDYKALLYKMKKLSIDQKPAA